MKKLLAILLALMMVLVSVAALAEGDNTDTNTDGQETTTPADGGAGAGTIDTSTWKSEATTFSENGFKKTFTTSGTSTTIYPTEALSFTSTPDTGNPDDTNISISNYTAESLNGFLTVNVPSYSKVGVYKYTISENAGGAQGVTYATNTVGLTVLVEYDYANSKLIPAVIGITKNTSGVKEDTFTNIYKLGKLTVSKEVKGNLGKKDQPFEITVTLTSTGKVYSDISLSNGNTIAGDGWNGDKTVTFELKDGESFELTNIPEGVTYTVVEADKHSAVDLNGTDGSKGYTVTYSGESGTISSTSDAAAKVTNTKNIDIDTGVALDSAVYMLILALAVAGFVALKVRRREDY